MRISTDEIAALLRTAPVTTRRTKRRSLDRLLAGVRRSMRTTLDDHMQAPMVLLDEAIRVVLTFEEFQFARKLTAETSSFALHTTRLRSDLLAVREMVKLGQASAALALARVFFEDIEIAMGLAIDPKFAIAYGESTNDDAFWSQHVGYGKIYPKVRQFLEKGGGDSEQTEIKLSRHKQLKTFLSGHIHPTSSSALHNVFPAAPKQPGMFFNRPLGALGTNLYPLCLTLADEIHIFSSCCINMFARPDPPPVFAGYQPCAELDDFLASAHVLQELNVKYFDALWEQHIRESSAWETGLSQIDT